MLLHSNQSFKKVFFKSKRTNPTVVYLKPFLLATLAAVVMPLFIGFVFSSITAIFFDRSKASHSLPDNVETNHMMQPMSQRTVASNIVKEESSPNTLY